MRTPFCDDGIFMSDQAPRHEPGRYLLGIAVPPPGPQTHLNTVAPTSVLVSGFVSSLYGVKTTEVLAASLRSAAAVVVTVTTPASVVVIDSTYLLGALAATPPVFCSQPQASAAGNVAPEADCTVSVMLVRHCDAASTTSDTLARIV